MATTAPSESARLDPTDPTSFIEVLKDSVRGLVEGFIESVPLYVIGLLVFLVGLFVVRRIARGVEAGLNRASFDHSLQLLTMQLVRAALTFFLTLLSLSVVGVEVGSALAALGLVGLAFAFAFQNILENFIAGILILMRRPFKVGDLIETNSYSGTVADINLRVTRLHNDDGKVFLIPNSQVFANAITNLTELGARRSRISFGIDYRDDHLAIPALLEPVVRNIEGVLHAPLADVLIDELGDSAVNFTVRFWSLPDNASVNATSARTLMAVKATLDAAGYTIPWPIRTIVNDDYGQA